MRPAAGQHGSGATAGAHQRQRQPCPGAGCRVSGDGVPAGGRCRPGTGGAAAAAEHSGELGAGHGCTARRSWVLGVCTACQPMCLNHDRQHPAAPACLCTHRVRPSLMFLTDTGQARRGLLACGLQVRYGAGRPSAEPALPRAAAQGRLILLRGKLLLRGSAGDLCGSMRRPFHFNAVPSSGLRASHVHSAFHGAAAACVPTALIAHCKPFIPISHAYPALCELPSTCVAL